MRALREGKLEHRFDDEWTVSKYEDWPFYRKHFQSQCADNKAVDFVARKPGGSLWLVELKDYRQHPRTKSIDLTLEIAEKVRDSLAGIFAAAKWHSAHANDAEARGHLAAEKIRLVLHLEQPAQHSKLFPRVFNPANVQEKLKQLVRAVDPHPLVVEVSSSSLPWDIASV